MKPSPKTILILLVVFIFILGLIIRIITPNIITQKPTSPAITPLETSVKFNTLSAGSSKLDEVIKEFGQPISSTQSGESTTYNFKSSNQYLPYEVTIDNETNQVEQINRPLVDKPQENLVEKYSKEFSSTPIKLFGQESLSGIYLYVFPEKGLALKATEKDGLGLSIRYFIPTDINTFIQKYAPNYSLTFDPKKYHD
jgi:hypothetical protein